MSMPEIAVRRLTGTALAPDGSKLVLAEWTAQGSSGDEPLYQAPLHKHPEDEAWYVLEGTLHVRAGEHVHEISAGGAVIVPGGTAHTFWNPRSDLARYLLVMGAQTFALVQAIHATDDRSPARMRQLYAAHGATLLGLAHFFGDCAFRSLKVSVCAVLRLEGRTRTLRRPSPDHEPGPVLLAPSRHIVGARSKRLVPA